MPLIAGYHRPTDLTEALDLLSTPGRIALAGGTVINADREPSDLEVVDLQSLNLDDITVENGVAQVGAMVRLDNLAHTFSGDLIGEASQRELPSTLRTLATVGGTVGAAMRDSLLLTAMLASACNVHYADGESAPLTSAIPSANRLITRVDFVAHGEWSIHSTARTPKDTPIVAAVGRRIGDRRHLAISGVADTPVFLSDTTDLTSLEPRGDFRGSAEYRLDVAQTLVRRIEKELA